MRTVAELEHETNTRYGVACCRSDVWEARGEQNFEGSARRRSPARLLTGLPGCDLPGVRFPRCPRTRCPGLTLAYYRLALCLLAARGAHASRQAGALLDCALFLEGEDNRHLRASVDLVLRILR